MIYVKMPNGKEYAVKKTFLGLIKCPWTVKHIEFLDDIFFCL